MKDYGKSTHGQLSLLSLLLVPAAIALLAFNYLLLGVDRLHQRVRFVVQI
eukprot:COSAG06_NODE_42150_length_384_cov_0.908772_2_plen_49_part_01